jgi:ABC-type branched-subunit amino acid transport system substrate-binding protein
MPFAEKRVAFAGCRYFCATVGEEISSQSTEAVMLKYATASLAFVFALGMGAAVCADKRYGPGVSDTEIKIGQTTAYSGPASAYGALLSKTQVAYVRMINERGGINGRRS